LKVSGEIQKLENLESSQENRIKKDWIWIYHRDFRANLQFSAFSF
jgi:hypothetical protein